MVAAGQQLAAEALPIRWGGKTLESCCGLDPTLVGPFPVQPQVDQVREEKSVGVKRRGRRRDSSASVEALAYRMAAMSHIHSGS